MTLFIEMYLETMIDHWSQVRLLGVLLGMLFAFVSALVVVAFRVDVFLVTVVGMTLWVVVYGMSAIIMVLMYFINDNLERSFGEKKQEESKGQL
jgi:ABC-type uncharacterized transport system permease subunit